MKHVEALNRGRVDGVTMRACGGSLTSRDTRTTTAGRVTYATCGDCGNTVAILHTAQRPDGVVVADDFDSTWARAFEGMGMPNGDWLGPACEDGTLP